MASHADPSVAFSGHLEDTGLAQVLKTIEDDALSGVLRLVRGSSRARLEFVAGKPVSVRAPGAKRLGDLLISQGLSDPITVREAARIQAEEQGRRQLGEILIAHGVVDQPTLDHAIELQIEQAIAELAAWGRGRYEFESAAPAPKNEPDLATWPPAGHDAETFNRSTNDLHVEKQPTPPRQIPTENSVLSPESLEAPSALSRSPLTIQFFSKDVLLREGIERALPPATGHLMDSEDSAVASGPDLGLLDLRRGGALSRRRALDPPRWPWAAVVETTDQAIEAYASGAIAALPAVPSAIVAALSTWAPLLPLPVGARTTSKPGLELATNSLPADSATVALGLMQSMSELVERAVLFLVGGRKLSSIGAFGTNRSGQLLAALTQGLVLDIASDSPLSVPLRSGRAASLSFDALHLPRSIASLLGSPTTGQSLLIPVSGGETVVAILYADNGDLDHWIVDLKPIEAVARRFGPSFETELLIGEAARTLG